MSGEILGPGFHRISKAEYLADPCERPSLSASVAHILARDSAAHAWVAHPRGDGLTEEPNAGMQRGTLIDSLLLGGDEEIVEVDVDDWRTKAAREARDAALSAGKLAVKSRDLQAARVAVEAIRARLDSEGIILDGEHQLTAIWKEGEVLCRGRLDHWSEARATIYDLKTADRAHPKAVANSMVAYGYDIQHAAYVSAIETLRPELAGRVRMLFLVVEPKPPYALVVAHPAGSMRARGQHYWRSAVATWGKCLAAGRWPSYPPGETEIEAPPWSLAEMEEGIAGGSPALPF